MHFGTDRLKRAVLLSLFAVPLASAAQAADELPSPLQFRDLGPSLLEDVREALPESSAVNQSFMDPAYDPNLRFSDNAQVGITFIDEGAGFRNSLGYFTYDDSSFVGMTFSDVDLNGSGNIDFNEINAVSGVSAEYLFANFSESGGGGRLDYGDTFVIGGGTMTENDDGSIVMSDGQVFEAGQNMGFFVSANAWDGRGIRGLDRGGSPANYFSVDFLNPEAGANANFYETPLVARHTAMMFADVERDDIIVGFEDLNRLGPSDEDFNDAVFIVRSDPIEALQGNSLDVSTAPGPGVGPITLAFSFGIVCMVYRRRKTNPVVEA